MEKETIAVERGIHTNKRRLFDLEYIILIVVVLIAIFFIIKLSRQNSLLNSLVRESSESLCGPQSLQVGDIIPAFKTVDLKGQPAEVIFNGSTKNLIFVFSAACDACAQEILAWNNIAAKSTSKKYSVRGISIDSLDDTNKNLSGKNLQFEVLMMPSVSILRACRVVSIPVVMIVSEQGAVEWFHYGAMTKEKVTELLSRLKTVS